MHPSARHLVKRKSATLKINDTVYKIVATAPKLGSSDIENVDGCNAATTTSSSCNQQESRHTREPQDGHYVASAALSAATGATKSPRHHDQAKECGRLVAGQPTSLSTTDKSSKLSTSGVQDTLKMNISQALERLRGVTELIKANSTGPLAVIQNDIGFVVGCLEQLTSLARSDCDAGDDCAESESDGEFSEVHQEAVPAEVREWLATTFTRQSAMLKRRGNGQVKFRAVANVIRMGLIVERLSRRTSAASIDVPLSVSSSFKTLDTWSYDVFHLCDVSNNRPLKYLGYELFSRYGFFNKFKIGASKLDTFLMVLEAGYAKHNNPYHNAMHAADVTQTVHFFLSRMGLMQFLTHLETMALILSALVHDVEHTGTTNNFHVNSFSPTALIYNDRSVLENHHVFTAFKILRQDECNFLNNLTRDEFMELRALVIDMVLATDMSSHFLQIKMMKNYAITTDTVADKSKVLSLMLHCSDISHPSKPWSLHNRWTRLLLDEFFKQGDLEKQLFLPVSPLCDRSSTLVPQSQIGFIEFIVEPSLAVCGEILERIHNYLHSSETSTPLVDSDDSASKTTTVFPWKHRPWDECLSVNKSNWKQQKQEADIAAIEGTDTDN